jgi:hypothetical protein
MQIYSIKAITCDAVWFLGVILPRIDGRSDRGIGICWHRLCLKIDTACRNQTTVTDKLSTRGVGSSLIYDFTCQRKLALKAQTNTNSVGILFWGPVQFTATKWTLRSFQTFFMDTLFVRIMILLWDSTTSWSKICETIVRFYKVESKILRFKSYDPMICDPSIQVLIRFRITILTTHKRNLSWGWTWWIFL